ASRALRAAWNAAKGSRTGPSSVAAGRVVVGLAHPAADRKRVIPVRKMVLRSIGNVLRCLQTRETKLLYFPQFTGRLRPPQVGTFSAGSARGRWVRRLRQKVE